MNKLPSNSGCILPKLLSLPCSAENRLFSQLLENLRSSYCHAAHRGGSHCLIHAALDGVIYPCQTILCCLSKAHRIRGLTLYTTAFLRTGFTAPQSFLQLFFSRISFSPSSSSLSFLHFWNDSYTKVGEWLVKNKRKALLCVQLIIQEAAFLEVLC